MRWRVHTQFGLLAAALFGVSACTPALPDRALDADVPPPEAWSANAQASAQPLIDGWLQTFEDDRLEELVRLAQVRNPDLRLAMARFQQARSSAKVAFADRLPSLNATFNPTRLQSRFTAPNGIVGVVRQNQFALSGEVNWELDVWGRVAANVAAADADYLASEADLVAARLSLGANVARSYYDVVSAAELLNLARESVESFDRSLKIVESRYRRGITNALDVRLAANSLESARALEVQRASGLDNARRSLETLLAQYPAGDIAVGGALPNLAALDGVGMPSDLLSRRPDVAASFIRLNAADYRVAAAKRQLLPTINLNGTSGNQTEIFSDFLDFDSLVWRITTSLTQPVFQGGRLRNQVKLNQARADEALANYAQVVLTAFREVETALANDRFLEDREAFSAAAVDEAAAAARLAQQQYSRGLTAILNLLDAQRRELDSRNQLIDIRSARVQNLVNLYLALGGPVTEESEEAPS
ncbi:MAG: TolC family protein, partial [Pseudomonadota bacterium]